MHAFATSWKVVVAATGVGAGAAGGALVLDDPAGRVLLGAAAALLLAAAAQAALLRPVLRVDGDGLEVRDGLRLVRLSWGEDDPSVRVVPQRVRLARGDWLEVDSATTLVLLHPLRLGASPTEVARQVAAVRSVSGR